MLTQPKLARAAPPWYAPDGRDLQIRGGSRNLSGKPITLPPRFRVVVLSLGCTKRSPMEINVRKLGNVQVVQIRGALRLGPGVDSFRQTIDEAMAAGDTRVVINFAEVPMIDSSGIGVLVKAMASAKQRGGGIRLLNPSKFVAQTLKLIGVLNLFEVFEDENTAVQSFH
jgi:anti-sigma B factor antagonist